MAEEKNKQIKIQKEGDNSPFILDLKSDAGHTPSFSDLEHKSPQYLPHKPRKWFSYYCLIKSYFLSAFYGERTAWLYKTRSKISFLDEFFFFFKAAFLTAMISIKCLVKVLLFLTGTFRDLLFKTKETSADPRLLYPEPSFAFEPVKFIKKEFVFFLIILVVIATPFFIVNVYSSLKITAVSAEERGRNAINILTPSLGGNFGDLESNLELASTNFYSAYRDLQDVNLFLRGILDVVPGNSAGQYRAAKKIFKAAYDLTSLAPSWTAVLDSLKGEKNNLKRLDILEKLVKTTEPKISSVSYALSSIDSNILPAEVGATFDSVRNYFFKAAEAFSELEDVVKLLREAIGGSEPKKYLLVFQNNTELRPTGGFMGSFAEIKFSKGEISQIYFPGGGTYDLRGMLRAFVAPPEPFNLVNERWEFQDANWFPDFPTSAKKIAWFYENSGGPTVDGVIAINANLVVDLLKFLGPIEMSAQGGSLPAEATPQALQAGASGGKNWNKVFTADNFIEEMQKAVEIEYDKTENQPKKILTEFYPLFLERLGLAWESNPIELIKAFGDAAKKKDVQFYFSNKDLENKVISCGMAGEVKSSESDYLFVVNTNIAGGKTDGVISEEHKLETQVFGDGEIVNTLTITRKHGGIKNQGFSGVRNVDYVRMYVPGGSRLISAEGFTRPDEKFFKTPLDGLKFDKDLAQTEKFVGYEPKSGMKISEEFGKTVFGNWIMVDPAAEVSYTLVYELPIKVDFLSKNFWSYTFIVQKQSGSNPIQFSHEFNAPSKIKEFWSYPAKKDGKNSLILEKDFSSAVILVPSGGDEIEIIN